mmetsp:Transcript_4403/g.10623  ORF Transcript_4403/g.10623 Transcript_4403/m.10623 type:complete len:217 (+) Transcript_4403:3-653(+)
MLKNIVITIYLIIGRGPWMMRSSIDLVTPHGHRIVVVVLPPRIHIAPPVPELSFCFVSFRSVSFRLAPPFCFWSRLVWSRHTSSPSASHRSVRTSISWGSGTFCGNRGGALGAFRGAPPLHRGSKRTSMMASTSIGTAAPNGDAVEDAVDDDDPPPPPLPWTLAKPHHSLRASCHRRSPLLTKACSSDGGVGAGSVAVSATAPASTASVANGPEWT